MAPDSRERGDEGEEVSKKSYLRREAAFVRGNSNAGRGTHRLESVKRRLKPLLMLRISRRHRSDMFEVTSVACVEERVKLVSTREWQRAPKERTHEDQN